MWDGFRGTGRLLVVDDDVAVARLTAMVLQQLGFEVDLVSGGAEALARLAVEDYRLVIVDLTMPDLDGVSVLESARARSCLMPFVLTSGCPREDVEQRLREHDFAGYLQKPYRMEQLVRLLKQLLGGIAPAADAPLSSGVELAKAERELPATVSRHR